MENKNSSKEENLKFKSFVSAICSSAELLLVAITVLFIPYTQNIIEATFPFSTGKGAAVAAWAFGAIFTHIYSKTISNYLLSNKDKTIDDMSKKINHLENDLNRHEKNILITKQENLKKEWETDGWKIHHIHMMQEVKEKVLEIIYESTSENCTTEENNLVTVISRKINKSDIFKPEKQQMMYDFVEKKSDSNILEENYADNQEENSNDGRYIMP